jgi:putative hydrolase of the HAD superfamily
MNDIYIFDLGGVLINLNVSRCMQAFEALMGEENMRSVLGMDSNGEGRKVSADSRTTDNVAAVSIATKQLMADFERGLISPEEFIREVLLYCHPGTTEEQVIEAWMFMLGDLPEERLDCVDRLRAQGHPVYLLSNGNDLHFDFINRTYGLDRHFVRLFLSQKMHLSKPDKTIFEQVDRQVREDNQAPEANIIFIDDIEANRRAAELSVGWHTFPSINACLSQ